MDPIPKNNTHFQFYIEPVLLIVQAQKATW